MVLNGDIDTDFPFERLHDALPPWADAHLVVVPTPADLDMHLAARIARERYGAQVSVALAEGRELVVLGGDEGRGRRGLDLGSMVDHLASKHQWIEAVSGEDHVARMRVRGLAEHPERLEEVISEVAMGRSILEG